MATVINRFEEWKTSFDVKFPSIGLLYFVSGGFLSNKDTAPEWTVTVFFGDGETAEDRIVLKGVTEAEVYDTVLRDAKDRIEEAMRSLKEDVSDV